VVLYLSPVETYCMNIDYYIPDEDNVTADFSQDEMTKIRKHIIRLLSIRKILENN